MSHFPIPFGPDILTEFYSRKEGFPVRSKSSQLVAFSDAHVRRTKKLSDESNLLLYSLNFEWDSWETLDLDDEGICCFI